MYLEKDGITYDVSHPTEITRLKGAGYKEVKSEEPVTDPAPKKSSAGHSKKEVKSEEPGKEGEG